MIAAIADVEQRHLDATDLDDLFEEDIVVAGEPLAVIGQHLLAILFLLGDGELPALEGDRALLFLVGRSLVGHPLPGGRLVGRRGRLGLRIRPNDGKKDCH